MEKEIRQEVIMYTDGSCLDNGKNGTGGYCAILRSPDGKKEKIVKGSELDTTNNRMEMTAIIEGIRAIKRPSNITVYSDSEYAVKAITERLQKWVQRNWRSSTKKPVANVDLWKEYLEVSSKHEIKAFWVKAHNGHPFNEKADKIANEEAQNLKRTKGVTYDS